MEERKKEQGFTLIELLVAIVVVGILTAVAIVGIAGLTDKGSKSACTATADAASAAAAVYYANSTNSAYPTSFNDIVNSTPKDLVLQNGVTNNGTTLTGKGWTLNFPADGQTFVC